MRVGELTSMAGLPLRFLHEPADAAGKRVRRTIITDLLDPSRYVTQGDLVITGLVWRRSTADSERFVAALISRGVVALAAGDALLGRIPEDLVAAARRHGLPLLEVPVEVDFTDVTEYVGSRTGSRGRGSLAIQRDLLSSVASGRSLDELVARVGTAIGRDCRVITPTGRHVVDGQRDLDEPAVDRIVTTFLGAERLPCRVPGDPPYTVFAVGSGLTSRLAAWLLVCEGDHTDLDSPDAQVLGELAAVAGLDRARREEGLRTSRLLADEALALIESGASQHDIGSRLRQLALAPDATVTVLVGALVGATVELTRALVEDAAAAYGPPVTAVDGDTVVALLESSTGMTASVQRALERLAPGLRIGRLRVGMSSPAAPDALAGAVDEARYAQRIAAERPQRVAVVSADEITSHVVLLASVPDDIRRSFAVRVLGPVLEYDRQHRTGLLETLAAFLDHSGSWSRTAEALHVHVNTVRYRIERVERLLDRDLSDIEERVDLFLALRSR